MAIDPKKFKSNFHPVPITPEGLNIVVYDCEIKNVIDGKNITWNDHDKMGLSIACLYDYADGDFKTYFQDDVQALAGRLNDAHLVVAFNQIGFDNKLVRACGGDLKPDSELKNFDMLIESRRAMGWTQRDRFPAEMKLDDHLENMFGIAKTEHGSQAPLMYQEGKMGELVSYCLADVRREKMLFDHIWQYGWVSTKAYGMHFVDYSRLFAALNYPF